MLVNDTKSAASTQLAYVLDDEVEIGTLVCHCLVACGYETRQFVSPAPFLTAVKTSPPELVVLDLALGQSDAVEVIHQIKSLNYAGKVLLISGRDEAYILCSLAADLHVTQLVDGTKGVHAMIAKSTFAR